MPANVQLVRVHSRRRRVSFRRRVVVGRPWVAHPVGEGIGWRSAADVICVVAIPGASRLGELKGQRVEVVVAVNVREPDTWTQGFLVVGRGRRRGLGGRRARGLVKVMPETVPHCDR